MMGILTSLLVLTTVASVSCGCERETQSSASPLLTDSTDYILNPPEQTERAVIGGVQRISTRNRPQASYYLITVLEDSIAWRFQIMCWDTTFAHRFCADTRHIQIGAAAANAWGECSDTSWSDVYEVKPDTLEIPLEATTGTDYNWILTPESIDRASDLASHIHLNTVPPTPCRTVSKWNVTSQTYTIYATAPLPIGDFALSPGEPVRVEVDSSCVWIVEQYRPKEEKWRWKSEKN